MNNNNLKIVLVEPQIPQNTGNIARLCACTGSELYIVGKTGFILSDKHMKRAGLDYWEDVDIKRYITFDELRADFPENNFYFLTTKSKKRYTDQTFRAGDFFVFGSETKGLSQEILDLMPENNLTIPMKEEQRSLNLSNTAAIVIYEAIRQIDLI